jgi:2-keto-4-pentenoate hydratase
VTALLWLARTTRELGDPLRAGARYTATLTGLGTVRAAFTRDPLGGGESIGLASVQGTDMARGQR